LRIPLGAYTDARATGVDHTTILAAWQAGVSPDSLTDCLHAGATLAEVFDAARHRIPLDAYADSRRAGADHLRVVASSRPCVAGIPWFLGDQEG
jgi:hypothetical protein